MAKLDIPVKNNTLKNTVDVQDQYFEFTDKVPKEVWYWAAIASILVSMALFFAKKRDWSIFVGQWPPTFLLFGLYHKVLKKAR